jgi:hypothetical protein
MIRVCLVALIAAVTLGSAPPVVRDLCATEDSAACVWAGPAQGNHRGKIVFNA